MLSFDSSRRASTTGVPAVWRLWLVMIAVAVSLTAAPAHAQQSSAGQGWWHTGYLVDYGLVAAGAAGAAVGESTTPRSEALIGPAYDPEEPAGVLDVEKLGRTYVEDETVPPTWLGAAIGAVGAGLAGVEIGRRAGTNRSYRRLHDTMVGYGEAVALTAAITSLTKPLVGRLRPDFADRARRFHCSYGEELEDRYCEGYRDRPLAEDRREARELLEDGRRSFISGHSAHSFNALTYGSLVAGGLWVWGEEATATSRIGGVVAQTVLMGTAAFVAGSRLLDGRHHPADVVVGGLVGAGVANMAYWRRFDAAGSLRSSGETTATVRGGLRPAGPVISFGGSF